jgi:hypothetical protein
MKKGLAFLIMTFICFYIIFKLPAAFLQQQREYFLTA